MEPSLEQIFGSYVAWEVKKGTWIISFMNGSEYMYLLEGREKALLIDTGYGTGTLRAFVERLTDREIVVANTHYHPDHSGGNGEFTEVYLSAGYPVDAPSVERPEAGPFDLSALPHPDYTKRVVGEGDRIELGGRTVEVLDVRPAHCNSSLFFLDRGERMLFTGDEFEAAQALLYDNSKNPDAPYEVRERLENLQANARRLLSLRADYDLIFPNHNGTPIAAEYLEDFDRLVDEVFAGRALIEDDLHHPFIEMDPIAPALCRVRCGRASIFIRRDELMKVYGSAEPQKQ